MWTGCSRVTWTVSVTMFVVLIFCYVFAIAMAVKRKCFGDGSELVCDFTAINLKMGNPAYINESELLNISWRDPLNYQQVIYFWTYSNRSYEYGLKKNSKTSWSKKKKLTVQIYKIHFSAFSKNKYIIRALELGTFLTCCKFLVLWWSHIVRTLYVSYTAWFRENHIYKQKCLSKYTCCWFPISSDIRSTLLF